MRKFIWILSLLITIHILPGKVKAGTGIYLPRTFETITNESVKSTLDKYFSDFEFGNKKYRILLTDDNTTYDYIHEKLLRYGNIGVLFMLQEPPFSAEYTPANTSKAHSNSKHYL